MFFYDCYDKNKTPITQVFAEDCTHLKTIVPNVEYVLGFDYIWRRAQWHRVNGEKNRLEPVGWRDQGE